MKTLTDEQYSELKTIAHSYGMSLGGYQTGITLYTSERTVHGKTYGELVTDLHAAGRECQARIHRAARRRSGIYN